MEFCHVDLDNHCIPMYDFLYEANMLHAHNICNLSGRSFHHRFRLFVKILFGKVGVFDT